MQTGCDDVSRCKRGMHNVGGRSVMKAVIEGRGQHGSGSCWAWPRGRCSSRRPAAAATPTLPSLVAYVRSGDVYVSKGATETRLTKDGGYSRPRWSPDGKQLALPQGRPAVDHEGRRHRQAPADHPRRLRPVLVARRQVDRLRLAVLHRRPGRLPDLGDRGRARSPRCCSRATAAARRCRPSPPSPPPRPARSATGCATTTRWPGRPTAPRSRSAAATASRSTTPA